MEKKEITIISKSTFLGKEIDVYGSVDEPLFKAKDVAEWLELTNVSDMVSRIDNDEVTKLNLGSLEGETWFLTEDGLYEVLMQSRKPQAKQFKKGVKEILKSIRKTGSYFSSSQMRDRVEASMIWVEGMKRLFNLSNAATLNLTKKVAEPLGLPAPEDIKSEGALLSARDLLKRHNIEMSPQAFNKLAESNGYLETLYRTDSKGKQKPFKNITTKGLSFGENRNDEHNLNETHPKWYVDKFSELLSKLGLV